MSRSRRIWRRKRRGELADTNFSQREYTSESPGGSRREERALIAEDDVKRLQKHWAIEELNPELLDELEAAWKRNYGPLPPIRHLKQNVAIKPSRLNLEEYDEETTTEP